MIKYRLINYNKCFIIERSIQCQSQDVMYVIRKLSFLDHLLPFTVVSIAVRTCAVYVEEEGPDLVLVKLNAISVDRIT